MSGKTNRWGVRCVGREGLVDLIMVWRGGKAWLGWLSSRGLCRVRSILEFT